MKSRQPPAASEIQEAGEELPLGGHQARTLATLRAGRAQARQGNNPQAADEKAAAVSRGIASHSNTDWSPALNCRYPQERVPGKGCPVVGANMGLQTERGSRQDPGLLGQKPCWSQDHAFQAAQELSPAPELAGAAQEVTGTQCLPEASTDLAGGREPGLCLR